LNDLFHEVKGKLTGRQSFLVICACVRRIWPVVPANCRTVVEVMERYAGGLAARAELDGVIEVADLRTWRSPTGLNAGWAALNKVLPFPFGHNLQAGMRAARTVTTAEDELLTEQAAQIAIVRDVVGNPYRRVKIDRSCRSPTALSLAQAIDAERAYDRVPILGDALEDAGCTDADILNHCRQPSEHVRGCWCVDLLLGKE